MSRCSSNLPKSPSEFDKEFHEKDGVDGIVEGFGHNDEDRVNGSVEDKAIGFNVKECRDCNSSPWNDQKRITRGIATLKIDDGWKQIGRNFTSLVWILTNGATTSSSKATTCSSKHPMVVFHVSSLL
ncbi:hypothetical protein L1987_44084 [Smallanthus sonchifolius]|uniref:Uncharacterized protein n=1 Tax=Smallanthus sonchifolius TaxID=185202 RepID=A0ACB9GPN9_9ASTR|nr:hypothetical protein L1987_44084 [Smallanthus sonchifolius]